MLRRLHQAARRGQKPKLPPAQLALALSIDRVRRSARNLGAIVRLHPAASMLPMLGLATLIALFLITSVSVRILHGPYLGPGSPPGDNGTQPGHAAQAPPYRTTISASRAPSVGGVALTSSSDPSATSAPSYGTSTTSSTTSPSATAPETTSGTPGTSGTVSTPVATVSVGASSTSGQGVSAAANVSAGSAVSVNAAASVSASSVAATTRISAGTADVGIGVTLGPSGAAASVSIAGTSVSVKTAAATPAPSTSPGNCLDIGPLGICLSA